MSKVADKLWGAVSTVAIADIVMSLDNVLAIAAAARGHPMLIGFGLRCRSHSSSPEPR